MSDAPLGYSGDRDRIKSANELRIEMLEAHVENLIERMAEMEEGHEFEFTAKCHTCAWTMTGTAPIEEFNEACNRHRFVEFDRESPKTHEPYVDHKVTHHDR